MPDVIKVLLIEDNRIEARQTQHWLDSATDGVFEVECVDQLKLGLERVAKGGIDIVLLDLNLPDSRGEATFDRLYAEIPEIPIVVLTGEYDEAIGPSTVAKGAQDYMVKQRANGASLINVLRYALARNGAQQAKLNALHLRKSGRVIGILGAKGGVGTTTAALNVATALAMQGKSVILAEMRPSLGTLAFHVHPQPAKTLRKLLELPLERIGQHDLKAFLCTGAAGVWILFGPKEDEQEVREIDPQKLEAIIKGLSQLAEFVILDLPTQPSDATRAAVSLCHYAAVVTEREPVSIWAGKIVVKQLQAWGAEGNQAGGIVRLGSIIVNRTIYSNYSMSFVEIQAEMGCELIGIVPFAAMENVKAQTEGVPLVFLNPEHDTALMFMEIASRLSAENIVGILPG